MDSSHTTRRLLYSLSSRPGVVWPQYEIHKLCECTLEAKYYRKIYYKINISCLIMIETTVLFSPLNRNGNYMYHLL
jgi:hypothetical protein